MPAEQAGAIHALLAYPKESTGRIMAVRFVAVSEDDSAADALRAFREMADAEPILDVYVVDEKGALRGVVGPSELLNADPAVRVNDLMQPAIASVALDVDQEQVARVFARYNLSSLPVVERENGRLVGVITADGMIDVIQADDTEDAMRLAGSDAAEMERRSPTQTALLRLPWIMATMFIELGARFVIHIYDGTLARVLLLASFMPIISAISGNRGCNRQRLSCGDYQPGKSRRAIGGGPSLDSSERMPTTGNGFRFSAP
jgi:magnesium transporter